MQLIHRLGTHCRSSLKAVRSSSRFHSKALQQDRRADSVGLESLEGRLLLSASVGSDLSQPDYLGNLTGLSTSSIVVEQLHDNDDHDGHDHDDDEICALPPIDFVPDDAEDGDDAAPFDLADTFFLHSRPGSSKTIYLDFDGHTTTEYWADRHNDGNPIVTPAYSFQGSTSSFTDAELERIQRIWQRVAEDFIPFNVNVTTEYPGMDAIRRSTSGDESYGIRVVIGGDGSWYGAYGGVANVNSFNNYSFFSADDRVECFVFEDRLGNGNEKYVAEAITHEVGHTLGLRHDGKGDEEYYTGHGSGATGWAPIMGVGYYEELTQWSKGEYDDATRTEDDLAIITNSSNGFGYRTDQHGNSIATASQLSQNANNIFGEGIIERNTDVDFFRFETFTGTVVINVDPFVRGPNLDILAKLYDSNGNVIQTSNPSNALNAGFNLTLTTGTYYISVEGTGKGDPATTGYSAYGSLGYFSITGTTAEELPDDIVNFSIATIHSYHGSAQDVNGTATVLDGGAGLRLSGNTWKAVDFNYNITADTVLEFEFSSTKRGEIHAIGFDNDLLMSEDRFFHLYGSQMWGIESFKTYSAFDGVVRYVIPVGQFYTGQMNYLTFSMDHDVANPTGESVFRNVRVYEDVSAPAPIASDELQLMVPVL